MKKICFLILLSSLVHATYSQAYRPMLKENKTWEDFHHEFNQLPIHLEKFHHEIYYLNGDSLINGLNYQKVYAHDTTYIGIQYATTQAVYPNQNNGFRLMREDSLLKKVWIKEITGDTSEYLLYDFSLNIGDTMVSSNYNDSHQAVIDSINPYILNNGDTTRAFYLTPISFSNLDPSFFVLEGIGSPISFIWPFETVFEHNAKLNCVKENSVTLFNSQWSNTPCNGIILSSNITQKKNSFTISPNPNNGENILITGKGISKIKVFNLQGQLIRDEERPNEERVINIKNQPKGIYFVKALFKNGNVVSKKLVLQ
jgi:hypothetical protein